MGNRLHALEFLRESLEPGEVMGAEIRDQLGSEFETLTSLVERNRILVFLDDEEPQPCRVADILPTAIALRALHVDVFEPGCEVQASGDPPAILAPLRALTQALALMLLPVGGESNLAASVGVTGTPEAVAVRVSGGAAVDSTEATRDAIGWLLRSVVPPVEIVREADASGAALRLTLPSLAASRRAERQQD
ncbi:MAG: hypothetical protein KF709_10315 [Gemmatimonadaceae bacterium]|nr:hypothetical protein [Gemmatimonadaceae bacterium]